MSYFDKNNTRRSCSAEAIVTTEVIEISFAAFGKTIENLQPWLKTIVDTLVERIKKANERIKSLESNSVATGPAGEYVFFHSIDVIRALSTLYLALTAHGEKLTENCFKIHLNKIKFYSNDIYNISEIKLEEFFQILIHENFIKLLPDEDNLPKMVQVESIDQFRSMMLFFNTQRMTEDSKKLKISSKCQRFLGAILHQLDQEKLGDAASATIDIKSILDDFEEKKIPIFEKDLDDAVAAGLTGEILIGSDSALSVIVQYQKLKKVFPAIRLMNAIENINNTKKKGQSY